jgi:hypothetical protein
MLLTDHLHETNLHVPHSAATIYVTALWFYICVREMLRRVGGGVEGKLAQLLCVYSLSEEPE